MPINTMTIVEDIIDKSIKVVVEKVMNVAISVSKGTKVHTITVMSAPLINQVNKNNLILILLSQEITIITTNHT